MTRLLALTLFFSMASVMSLESAQAYIPPSEYLVRQLAQKRAPLKGMRIRGTVLGLTAEGALSGVKFVEETTVDTAAGTYRSIALDETGRELYSVERQVRKGEPGRETWPLVSSLIFESQPGALVRLLRNWGIPVTTEEELLKLADEKERRAAEKTFFGRQKLPSGLQVSWVIGEKSSNQLWIEKDAFVPVKLVLGDGAELLMDSYRATRDIPVARVLTLRRGKTLELREEVQDVAVNAPDLVQARKSVANGFTEIGESVDSELRELIRRYFASIR